MTTPHTWHFATADTVPFVVEGNRPEAGAVGVPTTATATLEIAFNKALLAGSEATTSFLVQNLDDAMGQAYVPGQVTRLGNALRFTPDAPLDAGAVYQVYVAGATSFLGELQEGAYRWTFETLDAVPPQVVRTSPENGAVDVARNGALTVFFDQALLVGGEGVTFEVTDPSGEPIVGHLAWVKGDEDLEADIGLNTEGSYQGYRGLRFQPSMPLLASTTYQVLVKDVQNLAGLPMETYAWSFTTEGGATIFNTPTPVVRRYYLFSGQRVALRETGLDGQDVLYWTMGDHLGTTSLVLNEAGDTIVAESRHYPYGEERWRSPESGTFPTDLRFTGQRKHGYVNLYHMGARFYDPYINQFVQPDTIIPDFANPQSLNRYAYCFGNPIRLVDPSGHEPLFPMIDGMYGVGYVHHHYTPLDVEYPLGREPTEGEVHELARMIWNEEKGGLGPAMTAAAWVAVNRVNSPKFRYENKDLLVVLSAPGQFQGYPGEDPEVVTYPPAAEQWVLAQDISSGVLHGEEPDSTGGALFFCNGCGKELQYYQENIDSEFHFFQVEGYNMFYHVLYVDYEAMRKEMEGNPSDSQSSP